MKIIMLLDNTFTADKRVYNEATALAEAGHDVSLICIRGQDLPETEVIRQVKVYRLFTQDIVDFKKIGYFKKMIRVLADRFEYDAIHVHDMFLLRVGFGLKKLKSDAKLVYDSHEVFSQWHLTLGKTSSWLVYIKSVIVRTLWTRQEYRLAHKTNAMITVNESVAKILKDHFKLDYNLTVLRNLPEKSTGAGETVDLRKIFNIDPNRKVLVFVGANIFLHTRNLAQVILELGNVENLAIVFIGKNNQYRKETEAFAQAHSINNVYFHDAVPFAEIPRYLAGADAGLVPTWNKSSQSYWFALDNKIFDYIMAGIPILGTQQPEYINIIEGYKIGICVNPDVPGDFLRGFNQLMERKAEFLGNIPHAREVLNWDSEKLKLVELYQTL